MIMIKHIKMMQIPIVTCAQCFSHEKFLIPAIQVTVFGISKIPVLVQTLSYKSKITYHTLLIGFYHKLISMQDVWHVFHFNVAQQLSYSKFMHQCVFSLMKKMQSGTGNFLLTTI